MFYLRSKWFIIFCFSYEYVGNFGDTAPPANYSNASGPFSLGVKIPVQVYIVYIFVLPLIFPISL